MRSRSVISYSLFGSLPRRVLLGMLILNVSGHSVCLKSNPSKQLQIGWSMGRLLHGLLEVEVLADARENFLKVMQLE